MSAFHLSSTQGSRGVTLVELLISAAITSMMAAGLLVGSVLVQKSFAASRHYMDAQAQQVRLTDYMTLDLRRALTVATGPDQLTITIPQYYGADGTPINPTISNGTAKYGPTPTTISYFKNGSTIVRRVGNVDTVLARDVNDFRLTFQDLGQSITASVTFIPRYQFSAAKQASVRDGTATFTTTLLRNKRQSSTPQP